MTRGKPRSDRKRVIIDLSWPKGLGVNDGVNNNTYLGTQFKLYYPSVDDIVHKLKTSGVDIRRAFCHICIDPWDIDLLGLCHDHSNYIDLSLPFGFTLDFFSFRNSVMEYIIS